jgi:hypothetical protein
MKTLKVIMLLSIGLAVASCSDDENTTNKLSSEEQAAMVAASVGKSGFAGAGQQSAEYADESTGSGKIAECGFMSEYSGTFSGTLGSITLSYEYLYEVSLDCDSNEEPETFTSEFTYEGSFDGPRFTSEHAGSGLLMVTSLQESSETYEINGSYDRSGSFETKVNTQASGSSEVDLDINSVKIDKSTKQVIDGSIDAQIRGQISGKGSYSFDAHIEFKNDGTANIMVDNDVYVLNIATGEVTAQGDL